MFYKILKIIIGTAVRIFFKRITVSGAENIPSGKPLIIVSNHPSAFLDPLVLGILMERELYFFARADIFSSGIGKWIMKKANISPIYRIVDGIDSLEKNEAVFDHGFKLLSRNKALLLFGEGVTDEEFVRRVKNLKKGSMRISLGAEDKYDFKLGVNIVCAGLNYSDPREFRSDLLLNFSKPIEVLKYKPLFKEHNNRAMLELNKEVFLSLKEQIIHLENQDDCLMLEQILILTKKGINNDEFDENYSLVERWNFSKRVSEKINSASRESLVHLDRQLRSYFETVKSFGITDSAVAGFKQNSGSLWPEIFYLLIMLPVFLFGMVNNYLPVKLSTTFSRKISKRPVFWSGTDMAFSIITIPLYYFLIIYFVQLRTGNLYETLFYAMLMPLAGLAAFNYFKAYKKFRSNLKLHHQTRKDKKFYDSIAGQRKKLMEDIGTILNLN